MSLYISIFMSIIIFSTIFYQRKLIKQLLVHQPIEIKFLIVIVLLVLISVSIPYFVIAQNTISGGFYKFEVILVLLIILYFIINYAITHIKYLNCHKIVKSKFSYWIGMAMTTSSALLLSILLSLRTFPISEGWYSVYAKYINLGKIPYVDFELLFMPLYAYFIAFVTKIFGYDIIVLRVLGIIIFVILAALMYAILAKIFNPWIAVVASIVSIFYLQSEVAQVFYDYIRVFDLLTYAATLLLMLHMEKNFSFNKKEKTNKISLFIIVSGILASCALLIRQNSGAFVVAYTIMLLTYNILFSKDKRNNIYFLVQYIISMLIPIAILSLFLYSNGSLNAFLNSTVHSAIGSKGGVLTILFAWIPRWFNGMYQQAGYFVLFVLGIAISYIFYEKFKSTKDQRTKDFSVALTFIIAIFSGVILCFYNPGTSYVFKALTFKGMPNIVFVIPVLVFLFEFLHLLTIDKNDHQKLIWNIQLFTLTGMIIAIGYGSGTSAGLSEGQTALALGLIVSLLLMFSGNTFGTPIRIIVILMTVSMSLSIVSSKIIIPYSWWGLTESDMRQASDQIDVPYMNDILVSTQTKHGIETIVSITNEHSAPGDSIFAFPHIPIFYLLTDRYPVTFTLVQWFDVASDANVVKDIERIKTNLPKVIIHTRINEVIMISHETLFRNTEEKSGLRRMSEALDLIEKENNYVLAASINIQNFPVDIYYLDK